MMGVFVIIVVGIIGGSATEMVKAWAGRHSLSSRDVDEIKERLREQSAALEDAQATIASQAERLEELSERVDFAERLIARTREHPELGSGKPSPK